MPRRNRNPGPGREPGRMFDLENELHARWDRENRARIDREEEAATRRRYEQLRNRLTR